MQRLDLSKAVTPKFIPKHPRHRWYWFPHSFSPELVEEILQHWGLPQGAHLLDPFVGSGTTTLVAKQRRLQPVGFDISPLAVLVSKAKTESYDVQHLHAVKLQILDLAEEGIGSDQIDPSPFEGSRQLKKAFTHSEFQSLESLRIAIDRIATGAVRLFFTTALLSTLKVFSRGIASGGWLKWVDKEEASSEEIMQEFKRRAEIMISDVGQSLLPHLEADIREFDPLSEKIAASHFDAVITSPPYPNKHDYTRVFHVELAFLGKTEPEIKALRKQMLRSHVEGKLLPKSSEFKIPPILLESIRQIEGHVDRRLPKMLRGYFEDIFLLMENLKFATKRDAPIALVVGNVRYAGVDITVDELIREVAEQSGFIHEETWITRYRGNSAQQMARYGRTPMRESIVFLRNGN
ncbi:DNA methyltransferase [Thiolapillus sp.]